MSLTTEWEVTCFTVAVAMETKEGCGASKFSSFQFMSQACRHCYVIYGESEWGKKKIKMSEKFSTKSGNITAELHFVVITVPLFKFTREKMGLFVRERRGC